MKKCIFVVAALAVIVSFSCFAQTGDNLVAFREMYKAGTAPVNGTNCVQTLTVGAVTGGTFKITFESRTTAAISWIANNATLVSNIDTALEALPNIGTGGVTTAAGTIVNGANGTITVTFTGNRAKQVVSAMTVDSTGLTGGTITNAITTPGVNADGRSLPRGALVMASDTGKWYRNEGTPPNPTWVLMSTP